MSEQRECPNCGHETYRVEIHEGLTFLVCNECEERLPCEIWGPTETPPEEYQRFSHDLKNREKWEKGEMSAFEPLAEEAQDQANHFFNEEGKSWEQAKEQAIANVLDDAVWGRDLPADYDRNLAAQDIEWLLAPASAITDGILENFDVEMAEYRGEREGQAIVDMEDVEIDDFELMYWLEDMGIEVDVRHELQYHDERAEVFGTPVRFRIPEDWE